MKIYLNDVRLYAYHGCLSEEAIIGSDYRVDMWVEANLNKAKKSDSLKDTVDYVFLLSCIKKEMNVRSKLLEVVAERIISSVFSGSSIVRTVCVKISKINPPIGGNVESQLVALEEMKKNRELKKDFFRIEMFLVIGNQKTKGLSFGIFLTREKKWENILESFPFQIGQKSIFGNI